MPLVVGVGCGLVGLLGDIQASSAEILAIVIVAAAGVGLHRRSRRSYLDACLILAAATSVAAVVVTRAAATELMEFGLAHLAPATASKVVLVALAPLAGAMMLLAIPVRVGSVRALLTAAGIALSAAVVAILAAAMASVGVGALQTDHGMVLHGVSQLDAGALLLRLAAGLGVASAVVLAGIGINRNTRARTWPVLYAGAAAVAVYALDEAWSSTTW
jgi:hypothetical protein